MPQPQAIETLRQFEIPGVLSFIPGGGGLVKARVSTRWSEAEVYLYGAQVTGFQKKNEPPLLFLSRVSRFEPGKAIRGGVPICFPWFGPRAGDASHGFARITEWEVERASAVPEGGATLRFRLPEPANWREWSPIVAEFEATVTDQLTLQLAVTNGAKDQEFEFESCLHTYFAVGDVHQIWISGLESTPYLDHLQHEAPRPEAAPVRITAQTDRTYLDASGPVEIHDPVLNRRIRIEKSGSRSTVVWNPWTTQPLPDFGPGEYEQMVCVESGNVGRNRVRLLPGQTTTMKVVLNSSGLEGS